MIKSGALFRAQRSGAAKKDFLIVNFPISTNVVYKVFILKIKYLAYL